MRNLAFLSITGFTILVSSCGSATSSEASKNAKSDVDKPKMSAATSEITCPNCGFKKVEELPTDQCTIRYTCEKCATELTPKTGDCCVFCTYGTHKCPSKQ